MLEPTPRHTFWSPRYTQKQALLFQGTPKPVPIQQSNAYAPRTSTRAHFVLLSVVILTIYRINHPEPKLVFPQDYLLYSQTSVPSCKELQVPHASLQLNCHLLILSGLNRNYLKVGLSSSTLNAFVTVTTHL